MREPQEPSLRDDGAAGVVELLLGFTLIVTMTFLSFQVVGYLHARNLAAAAAQDAAHAAAAADLSAGEASAQGEQAAGRILDGERSLTGVTVSVNRGTTTATATVMGQSMPVIPGLTWNVDVSSQAGVERFVGRGQTQ